MELNVVVSTFTESLAFAPCAPVTSAAPNNSLTPPSSPTAVSLTSARSAGAQTRAKLEVTRLRPDENDASAGQDEVATCPQCDRNPEGRIA